MLVNVEWRVILANNVIFQQCEPIKVASLKVVPGWLLIETPIRMSEELRTDPEMQAGPVLAVQMQLQLQMP